MSRARGRKQQEAREFFTENPELIEYDTVISVGQDQNGFFELQAVDGLGNPLGVSHNDGPPPTEDITVAIDAVVFGRGFLDATSEPPFVQDNRPFDADLTFSENGIGILGEDDGQIPQVAFDGEGDFDLPPDADAINSGETLEFDVFLPKGPPIRPAGLEDGIEPPLFEVPGITDLLIEYTVLNDGGGVVALEFEQNFFREGDAPSVDPEVMFINPDSEDDAGRFELDFEGMDGVSGWNLSVFGDVEIAVTGISYGTNFDADVFGIPL